MRYVIVTVEWCTEHGIIVPEQARRSVDGKKVILHEDFVKPVISDREKGTVASYNYNSEELYAILEGEEWKGEKQ